MKGPFVMIILRMMRRLFTEGWELCLIRVRAGSSSGIGASFTNCIKTPQIRNVGSPLDCLSKTHRSPLATLDESDVPEARYVGGVGRSGAGSRDMRDEVRLATELFYCLISFPI